MRWLKKLINSGAVLCGLLAAQKESACGQQIAGRSNYFISPQGEDSNPGTLGKPWRSLGPVSATHFHAGDSIFLYGGAHFQGTIKIAGLSGADAQGSIVVCSYGPGAAVIDAGNETAMWLDGVRFFSVYNLILKGSGRKSGNTGRGLWLTRCKDVKISALNVSGFQKSGIEILDCARIQIERVNSHDNGFAGIALMGSHFPDRSNSQILIRACQATNNPGDPTELSNHSGNGIIVGLSKRVMVEYCVSTNNGWDMPRKGNGPVGIWAWESDSIIIQHCISFRNRTSPGSMDGGGFDLDGGVTYSTVQYNLSYENEGYGFGIFQFSGASPWHHNTFRFNISYNDGNVTAHGASVLWWNGSKDPKQFQDCFFYNNLLYNTAGYALGIIPEQRDNRGFLFLNNILIAKKEIMSGGKIEHELFYGNDWWSVEDGFNMNGYKNFQDWISHTGQEQWKGHTFGINAPPELKDPRVPTLTDPSQLASLVGFQPQASSLLRNRGIDLRHFISIDAPVHDFYGQRIDLDQGTEPGVYYFKK